MGEKSRCGDVEWDRTGGYEQTWRQCPRVATCIVEADGLYVPLVLMSTCDEHAAERVEAGWRRRPHRRPAVA
jgi:hypothetical protein